MAAELAGWVADEPGFTLAAPAVARAGVPAPRLRRAHPGGVGAGQRVGRAFLTHTVVDGRVVIRVAIGGVTTERAHVVALWEQLRKAASAV